MVSSGLPLFIFLQPSADPASHCSTAVNACALFDRYHSSFDSGGVVVEVGGEEGEVV